DHVDPAVQRFERGDMPPAWREYRGRDGEARPGPLDPDAAGGGVPGTDRVGFVQREDAAAVRRKRGPADGAFAARASRQFRAGLRLPAPPGRPRPPADRPAAVRRERRHEAGAAEPVPARVIARDQQLAARPFAQLKASRAAVAEPNAVVPGAAAAPRRFGV